MRLITYILYLSYILFYIVVDCEWSTWTTGQCSKTCGGGQRTDTRLKHVEAQFGGEECVGDASQQVSCNTDECAGKG